MKTAIITGATRGIGREIALTLAKEGYNVIINYTSSDEAAKSLKEECDKYAEALIVKADVSDYAQAETLVSEVMEKYHQIDVLVNNAGITRDNLVLRMNENDFDRVIEVNLKGTFNMCKHVSKMMFKARSGKIINMASVIGEIGNIGQANYAASKGGIIALTKSLAKEFAARNITVNAIAPGFIKTDMTNTLGEDMTKAIVENIPLKRMGEAKDVANLVNFLISENASYITGQVINVDGGMVM